MAVNDPSIRLTTFRSSVSTDSSSVSLQGKLKMNRPDSIKELIFKENKGYRTELLERDTDACDFLRKLTICGRCSGVLNRPCLMRRIPQMMVCASCLNEHEKDTNLTIIQEAILDLEAKCPLRDRGCGWNGNLGDLEKHMDVCEKLIVACPQECNSVVERTNLKPHMENECEMRMLVCKYCKVEHYMRDAHTHIDKCQYFPVKCTCGEQIRRKDFDSHKRDICKDTVVECTFKKYGCIETFCRGDRGAHEHLKKTDHMCLRMNWLGKKIERLEEVNERLANELYVFEELATYALVLNWKIDLKRLKNSAPVEGPTFTVPSCSIKFYTKYSLNGNELVLSVSVWPINMKEAFAYDFWTILVDQDEGKLCKTRDGHYRCFDNKEVTTNSPIESNMVIAKIHTANLNKINFKKNGISNVKLYTQNHV